MNSHGTGEHSKGWWLVALVGLIVAGAVLRVYALDQQGYWHDELYSVAHLSGFDAYVLPSSDLDVVEPPRSAAEWREEVREDRFWRTLERNLVHEGHPPLYQVGLKGWTSLFGRSVEAVRSFSLLPAVLTIPVLFLLGRQLRGPGVGAMAALLLVVSPYHLYYSVEARNYAWALFLSSLALLAAVGLWQNREAESRKWWVLWWISVTGACYAHYYAGMYCAVLMVFLVALRRRSAGAALKVGLPFLLFLPWLPVLQDQIGIHGADHWTADAPGMLEAGSGFAGALLEQLTGVFDSATPAERIVGGVTLVAGVSVVLRDPLDEDTGFDARWLLLSVPVFGVAVLSVDLITDHHTILVSRYLISALPALLLVCAWLVVRRQAAYRLLLASLVAGNLVGAVATASGERAPKQMLREAGSYIGSRYAAEDLVLVTPSGPTLLGMARYLPRHARVAAVPPSRAGKVAGWVASAGGTVWLARQNLGLADELGEVEVPPSAGDPVRFSGIDVIPVRGARKP